MIQGLGYTVTGGDKIHCHGCENRIAHALGRIQGVHGVLASAETQIITVSIDTDHVASDQIERRLEQLGYRVAPV